MPAPRLPPDAADAPLTLLGRERQLSSVGRAVDRVRTGRAQFVLIEGESGFGKTAMLRAAVQTVPHWPLRAAVADENETELPYGVLNQLLADLDEPEQLEPLLADGVAADVSPMVAGAALLALIDASEGATCVTIDDAQWVDQQSAEALWFAGRRSFSDRLLVILTARPEETPFLERMRRLVADEERGVHLRVGGLNQEQVATLTRRKTGLSAPRRVAEQLLSATDGNVLHAQTILNQVASGPDPLGSLDRLLRGTPPVAPRFRSVTRHTLAGLGPAARAVLEIVAVLNDASTITDVTAVAAAYGGFRVSTADVDEALATGLVVLAADDEVIRMPHQRVRTVIVTDLSLQAKRQLNAAAGGVIGGHRGLAHRVHAAAGPDESLARELDASAAAAAASHQVQRAFRYALWAASLSRRPADKERRVLDAGVYALAARRSGLLVTAIDDFENLSAGPDREVLLGSAALARADLVSARQHLLSAVTVDAPGNARSKALRASAAETLAALALADEDFDATLRFAATTLETIADLRAGDPSSGLAKLELTEMEGSAVCWSALAAWQRSGSTEWSTRIDELIREASLGAVQPSHGLLFITRGFLRRQQQQLAEAIDDLQLGIELTDLGRPELAPHARIELALVRFRNGEWDEAAAVAAAAASLAEDVQNPWLKATTDAVAAIVPAARGDRLVAEAWLDAAESGPKRLQAPGVARLTALARALLARAVGDTTTVVTLARHAIATDPEFAQVERAWWQELLDEANRPATPASTADPLAVLSGREREVAHLAAQGLTNREVAERLFVSIKGVEYHMGNVLAKLNLNTRRGIRALIEEHRRTIQGN